MQKPQRSLACAFRRAFHTAFVLLLVNLFALPQAQAQRGPRGPMDEDEYLNHTMAALSEQVGISEAQAEQIRPVLAEQFDRQQAMRRELRAQMQREGRGGGRETMQAMREQIDGLRRKTDAQIEAVLTEEQVARYRTFREAQRERPRRRAGRRSGP